jgi:KaiC/GvpD/RAD55 family RecA-like ATPase
MKLLETRIAGFDELCNGGLPPGVVLLYGVPGSGKEIFSQQTLFDRAKTGGKVTYFTTNRSSDAVESDIAVYGWDVSSFKKNDNWRFIDLREVNSVLGTVEKEMKDGRWITIDSLSELLLTQNLQTIIDLLNSMSTHSRKLEELNFALLTEGMHDVKVETAMHHFADGVISFLIGGRAGAVVNTIAINKMKRMVISNRSIPFSIRDIGLVIETAVRIA